MLGLNRNIWILALAQPFALSLSPAIVLISGFIGTQLAPAHALATLPLSMMVVGVTLGAMPAAFFMQRFGRKKVFLSAMLIMMLAGLISALGIWLHSFILFLFGVTITGMSLAAVQQFRFAAIEQVDTPALSSRAVSVLMLGNVAAAFIGTELASIGQHWFAVEYAGSFIAILLSIVIAFVLLLFFKPSTDTVVTQKKKQPVNWRDILSRPAFILAVAAATIGYGVMSFVMTATPLAMHEMTGHSLESTKWVIQSHIMAMFLPSFITGELIRKWGETRIIFIGLLAYLGTTAFAFSGVEVFHYWWALVLLGVGWNFLFIGGTTLLSKTYTAEEKFSVQAANDMTVFVFQALSSLSAGAILFISGWHGIVVMSLVPTVLLLLGLLLMVKRFGVMLKS
jgi:MFS family permease